MTNWYRGDCHVHSVHSSGGELTPEQLAVAARAVGLDFIVGTEHNTAAAHGLWRRLDGPDLLVMLGQEVVTRQGHWVAVGLMPGQVVPWDYDAGDRSPTSPAAGGAPRSATAIRTSPDRSVCRTPLSLPTTSVPPHCSPPSEQAAAGSPNRLPCAWTSPHPPPTATPASASSSRPEATRPSPA